VIDFDLKALPNQSTQQIYHGKVGIQRKILGLFNINSNITNRSFNAQSYMLPLDNSPGGQISFSDASSVGIPSSLSNLLQVKAFSFIPAESALNVGGGHATINTAQLDAAYSISNPPASPYDVPFSNFVTAVRTTNVINEDHVTFTPRNADLILKELQLNYTPPTNCTQVCSTGAYSITGPANFCQNGTYSINNLPSGATVNWSVNGNAAISGSPTNVVNLVQTGTGVATLSAIINSTCAIDQLPDLTIQVGLQTLTGSDYVDRSPQQDNYQYVTSTVTQLPGTTPGNYTWYQEVNNVAGPQIGYGLQLNHYPIAPGTVVYFRCEAVTPCGTAVYRSYAYNTNSGGSMAAAYTVYPNPAVNTVSVSAVPSNSTVTTTNSLSNTPAFDYKPFDVILLNDKGVELRTTQSNKQKTITFDIKDIPNGFYFIHIIENGTLIRKQFAINR
jgi:hypothetical protein